MVRRRLRGAQVHRLEALTQNVCAAARAGSPVHPLTHPSTHLLTRPPTYSLAHLPPHSCRYVPTLGLLLQLSYLPTHSLAYSLTYLLRYVPTLRLLLQLVVASQAHYPDLYAVLKFVPKKNGLNPILARSHALHSPCPAPHLPLAISDLLPPSTPLLPY